MELLCNGNVDTDTGLFFNCFPSTKFEESFQTQIFLIKRTINARFNIEKDNILCNSIKNSYLLFDAFECNVDKIGCNIQCNKMRSMKLFPVFVCFFICEVVIGPAHLEAVIISVRDTRPQVLFVPRYVFWLQRAHAAQKCYFYP